MAIPSLDDLLAQLDEQEALEGRDSAPQVAPVETKLPREEPVKTEDSHCELREQAGGSSSSSGQKRRGGRFSDLCGKGPSPLAASVSGQQAVEEPLQVPAAQRSGKNPEVNGLRDNVPASLANGYKEPPSTAGTTMGSPQLSADCGRGEPAPPSFAAVPSGSVGAAEWKSAAVCGPFGEDEVLPGPDADEREFLHDDASSRYHAEGVQNELPDLSDLLIQLDEDVELSERLRAQEEAAAFEERQRLARLEAEEREREEQQQRIERAREEWERRRMAAEEAEERRIRANRYANVLEEKTRRLAQKQSLKRCKEKEEAIKQRQREKERRKEEQLRNAAAEMSEKMRRMAENGYALGPTGWVRLDWLSSDDAAPADLELPKPQANKIDEEQSEHESQKEEDQVDTPFEVVDQRPLPDLSQRQPEAPDLEEVLADLDQKQKEGWASGAIAPALDEVLEVLQNEERRDLQEEAAGEVRKSFKELGRADEMVEDELPIDPSVSSARILQVASQKKPGADFSKEIKTESALKPWNDFIEEKQEGKNSYEERQARSAAIQAKLQAARNRLSLVRYERSSAAAAAVPLPDPGPQHKASQRSQGPHQRSIGFEESQPAVQTFSSNSGAQADFSQCGPSSWSWLNPGS